MARIRSDLPASDLNHISNLVLLCRSCHRDIVDKKGSEESPEGLRAIKNDHELAVHRMKSHYFKAEETATVRFSWPINGEETANDDRDIRRAIWPRIEKEEPLFQVAETLHGLSDDDTLAAGVKKIDQEAARMDGRTQVRCAHRSVFGIGPIPLLAHLGSRLSDKVVTDLYQRHRNPEGWEWKAGTQTSRFITRRTQKGNDNSNVAVLASVSGSIRADQLPESIGATYTIYELLPEGQEPGTSVISSPASIDSFKDAFLELLGRIHRDHHPPEIHVFAAVPAPVAITLGRAPLKIHPPLVVYDYDKPSDRYKSTGLIIKKV